MAKDRVCTIDGCFKPVKCRGWCSAHHAMWQKYGDPCKRQVVEYGAPLAWLKSHSNYQEEICLPWPFAGNGNGYGQVRVDGVAQYPHRVMCRLAHGEPTPEKPQAAHSCGNRWCVNPKHLRWADQSGNELDKADHGRDIRGEKHHNARLTESDILRIRSLDGIATHKIAAEAFGVSTATIEDVINRRTWAWLA